MPKFINIRFGDEDEALYESAKELADKERRPMAQWVRNLIQDAIQASKG